MKWNRHTLVTLMAISLPFNLTGCMYAGVMGGGIYGSVYDSVYYKSKDITYEDSMLLPSDGKLVFISKNSLPDTSTRGNRGLELLYTSAIPDKTVNKYLTVYIKSIPKSDSNEFTFNLPSYKDYNLRTVVFHGKYIFRLETFSDSRTWDYDPACDQDNPYTGILDDYKSYQDLIVIPVLADKYSKYRMTCHGNAHSSFNDSLYLKKESPPPL